MKKDKLLTTIGPVIVIIVCALLAINVIALNTKLSNVKVKLVKVYELEKQVENLRANYEKQYKIAEGLQKDIEDLQIINADLETRLKGAMNALSAPTAPAAPVAPVVVVPAE
ncbi:MAG: hypothetical protein ABH848_02200 [Candidatus Omnitrophota bacterium]